MTEVDLVNHLSGDVDPVKAKALYAVQQPLAASAFNDVRAAAAWKLLPSWYLVAQDDQALPPDAQRMFAQPHECNDCRSPLWPLGDGLPPAEVVKLTETTAEAALAGTAVH